MVFPKSELAIPPLPAHAAGAFVDPPLAERFVFAEEATRGVTKDEVLRAPLASLRTLLSAWPTLYFLLAVLPLADLLGFAIELWFRPSNPAGRGLPTAGTAVGMFALYAWVLNSLALARRVNYYFFDGLELVFSENDCKKRYRIEAARGAIFWLDADGRVKRIDLKFGGKRQFAVFGLARMDEFAAQLRALLPADIALSKPVPRIDFRPLVGVLALNAFVQHMLWLEDLQVLLPCEIAILYLYYRAEIHVLWSFWRWSRR